MSNGVNKLNHIYKWLIEKSLPNNHKLYGITTGSNTFEVKTAKGDDQTNYVHFYKIEEHPRLI